LKNTDDTVAEEDIGEGDQERLRAWVVGKTVSGNAGRQICRPYTFEGTAVRPLTRALRRGLQA
jgi:hypothetical protein